VFPARYELNLYVQFRLNLSFTGLINTFAVISKMWRLIQRACEGVHNPITNDPLGILTNNTISVTKF
jgi:hypothetical protein